MGGLLTQEQIDAGAATLAGGKLRQSQVDDILSIWRGYLGGLASSYSLSSTLSGAQDDAVSNKCAKLAACLQLWQDVQFDVSAFAATNANRTGFTDSTKDERYEIFLYSFGLFWDIPSSLASKVSGPNVSNASSQYLGQKIGK